MREKDEQRQAYLNDPRRAADRPVNVSLWRAVFPPKEERDGEALLRSAELGGPGASQALALKAVAKALKSGADVDFATMGEELRALHLAARVNFDEVCEALIKAGANIEAWDMNQSTPLQIAAEAGSLESAKALLAAGADPNAASGAFKRSALHIAADKGDADMAALLMSFGAKQSQDHAGRFPFHYAIGGGEAARVLVEMGGADPEALDHEGKTALSMAEFRRVSEQAVEDHRRWLGWAMARREAAAIGDGMEDAKREDPEASRGRMRI